MNAQRAHKSLVFHYYIIYALLILELVLAKLLVFPFEIPESHEYVLQVFVILFLLVTIPVTLKLYSVKTKYNKGIDFYVKQSKIHMWVLSLPAFFSGLAFYFTKDTDSLLCYLIAFVALIFTKPSVAKIEAYLERPSSEGEENSETSDSENN